MKEVIQPDPLLQPIEVISACGTNVALPTRHSGVLSPTKTVRPGVCNLFLWLLHRPHSSTECPSAIEENARIIKASAYIRIYWKCHEGVPYQQKMQATCHTLGMAGNRVQRAAANGLASELVTDWSDRQALHRVPYHCRPAVHQRSRRAPSLDVDLRQAGSGGWPGADDLCLSAWHRQLPGHEVR